jgi:CheY-like chemotaxis protein
VLINLLSNAIKYNTENGVVDVTFIEEGNGSVRTSIMDSGIGLSPDQMQELFKPFNRLGQDKGDEEGTGIGLVVAKRLVELMGGVIGVESAVGEGSVFWFELPAITEPQLLVSDNEPESVEPQFSHEQLPFTLLYVEDNPANLRLVEQIIAHHLEITMLSAENGDCGVEIARESLPDVILMDINLPGMSGIEAMQILHQDPETAHIPIIAISANAMKQDIERGMEAGFFRYITKPIKVDELMDSLNQALEYTHSIVR